MLNYVFYVLQWGSEHTPAVRKRSQSKGGNENPKKATEKKASLCRLAPTGALGIKEGEHSGVARVWEAPSEPPSEQAHIL